MGGEGAEEEEALRVEGEKGGAEKGKVGIGEGGERRGEVGAGKKEGFEEVGRSCEEKKERRGGEGRGAQRSRGRRAHLSCALHRAEGEPIDLKGDRISRADGPGMGRGEE